MKRTSQDMELPDSPEHLHLLLVHVPLIGLLAAIIPVASGIVLKSRGTLVVGLTITAVFSLPTPFIMASGEEAAERFEHEEVRPLLDGAGMQWLEVHEDRAGGVGKAFDTPLVLSIGALILAFARPRGIRPSSAAVLASLIVCVVLGTWISHSGGRIRHPELRPASQSTATASVSHE